MATLMSFLSAVDRLFVAVARPFGAAEKSTERR